MKLGDHVTYWENYRSKGESGGWRKYYYTGRVVKVNRQTAQVQRQVGRRTASGFMTYGYESTVRAIPLERCELQEAA